MVNGNHSRGLCTMLAILTETFFKGKDNLGQSIPPL